MKGRRRTRDVRHTQRAEMRVPQDVESRRAPIKCDDAPKDLKPRRALIEGKRVIWPRGLELRLGISAITRWRWERAGKLPPRDVHIGGRSGWSPDTLAAAEQSMP
jgi:hypothetical protein